MAGVALTGFVGFSAAALQGSASPSGTTWLWIAAVISLGVGVAAGIGWLITRPDGESSKQVAVHQVAAQRDTSDSNVLQAGRDVNVGGNLTVGGVQSEGQPGPTISMQVNQSSGYLWVTNPGVADNFVVRVSRFIHSQPGLTMRPVWSTGGDERTLKKGESDWLIILTVEPSRPVIAPVVSIFNKHLIEPWLKRVKRGVRVARFYGEPQDRDIEVPANQRFVFTVTVLSNTRSPESAEFSYGITENCLLVIPFDQQEIDRINQESKVQTEELLKMLEATRSMNDLEGRQLEADK